MIKDMQKKCYVAFIPIKVNKIQLKLVKETPNQVELLCTTIQL